jgi:DNA-binding CsgD family transcriptional regulator
MKTPNTSGQDNVDILATELSEQALSDHNQLILVLYRCLQSNEGFTPFFDAFRSHFNALHGGILCIKENPQRISYGWTFGYPEGFEEWFFHSDLPEQDEAITRFKQLPPRQFDSFLQGDNDRTLLDLLTPDSPSRPWVEEGGVGDSAGMLISQGSDHKIIFIANRHKEFGAYTREQLLQMNLLAPHIENVISLNTKLYESRSNNKSLAIALNHVNKPLIVFNAMARIAKANDSALALLENSGLLHIHEGNYLRSQDANADRRLNSAIATCIIHSHQNTPEPKIIFLNNSDERLAVFLTPLIANNSDDNGVLAELFSYLPDIEADMSKLRSLFDCTAAEASVAKELMHGFSATEIAEKNSVSIHTVRQQIKSLLAKNGYHKQTELVAMLVRALA